MQFCCGGEWRCYLTDVKPLPLMKRPRNGRTKRYPTASVELGEQAATGICGMGLVPHTFHSASRYTGVAEPLAAICPPNPTLSNPSVLTSSPTHRNATNER